MIVDDNLFQELLDRVTALEHKVGILENRLTAKEATRISAPAPSPSASNSPSAPVRERGPSTLLDKFASERRGH